MTKSEYKRLRRWLHKTGANGYDIYVRIPCDEDVWSIVVRYLPKFFGSVPTTVVDTDNGYAEVNLAYVPYERLIRYASQLKVLDGILTGLFGILPILTIYPRS